MVEGCEDDCAPKDPLLERANRPALYLSKTRDDRGPSRYSKKTQHYALSLCAVQDYAGSVHEGYRHLTETSKILLKRTIWQL